MARKIMHMKNSSDTIGNRIRDLPSCSAVPQPTAPPRLVSRKSRLHVFQEKTGSDYPNEQKCHYLIQRQGNHKASTVVDEVIRIGLSELTEDYGFSYLQKREQYL